MNADLADVQVCLPGRGCVMYVPAEGHVLNAAIAIGPQALDVFFAAVLVTLVLLAAIAVVTALRIRAQPRGGDSLGRTTRTISAALLVGGGALAAVPPVAPTAALVAEVFELAASTCVGVAFLLLAPSLPRVARVALVVAGTLRLLSLPVSVLQFASAAPLGPFPSDVVIVLGDLTLAFAGLVLLLAGRGFGALRWALLLPPVAALLTGIRLGLPFAVDSRIDLLPDVAVAVLGLLVLVSRSDMVSPARSTRRAAVQGGGAAAALALTLVAILAWPTSGVTIRGAGEPAIGPVRVVAASTRIALPLDTYQQSFVDRSDVIRAENRLITVCAARRGLSVHAADLLPPPTVESNSSLLGLIDAQQAAATGYWVAPTAEMSGGLQSEHDLRVLMSCVSAARTRLGDDGNAQRVVQVAEGMALTSTDADSRVRSVEAAWSRCMQLRGFPYPTPMAVALTQAEAFPTPSSTRKASASVACERVVNVPGLRGAVLAAYEKQAIAAHAAKLGAARLALVAQKRIASALLRATSLESSPRCNGVLPSARQGPPG